jgi:N-acetylmuramoyl-L-alanine amidase
MWRSSERALRSTAAEGSRKRSILRVSAVLWATATIAATALLGAAPAQAWAPIAAFQATLRAPKPAITPDPISFGNDRKRQTARYSERHYGQREWRLTEPRVIVLHFTASDSYSSVWNTFEANTPNLGESPGTCAHYVIEQDGTIDELVPTSIRCRHTIGLNQTSIGIEMVQATGPSSHWADQQILNRRKQIGSALRLVRWLQDRYAIPTNEVIGHSMANGNRYFKDLEGWVNDHTDWLKRDVKEFRSRL